MGDLSVLVVMYDPTWLKERDKENVTKEVNKCVVARAKQWAYTSVNTYCSYDDASILDDLLQANPFAGGCRWHAW